MIRRFGGLILAPALVTSAWSQSTITILHTNDQHARVLPATLKGKEYGGQARLATLIRRESASSTNPLLLDAGDTFQGTIFFNVYEGLTGAAFMNEIGYRAMALGNHEFDRGPATLARFLRQLNFVALAANLDVSAEPELVGLVLPSTMLQIGDQKVGVVGAITEEVFQISSPGPNVRLLDTQKSVQAEIDKLRGEGLDKILLLSHRGYEEDVELAPKLHGLDVIVGGHSHSILGDLEIDGAPKSRGPYPTVTKNADGETVLVVQAWEWGKLLGKLAVDFDARGRVENWSKGDPILVDESVPEDKIVGSMVEAFKLPVESTMNAPVSEATAEITNAGARSGASTMANLIADAMLESTASFGSVAAFMNGGGVRASFEPGPVTYGEALAVQPFANTMVLLEVTGRELLDALEYGARGLPEGSGGLLLPSSGTSYEVHVSEPQGKRVQNVMLGGKPLELGKTYRITLNNFTAGGGDGHEVLKAVRGYRNDTGLVDIEGFVAFLKRHNPISPDTTKRIVIVR